MAADDLIAVMQREREKYLEQRNRARTELEEAERWLQKIDAFLAEERVAARAGERRKGTRTRMPKEQTAKVRQDVLDAIGRNPDQGLAARDLYGTLEPLGYQRSAINAALLRLSKEGVIHQAGRRQPYRISSRAGTPEAKVPLSEERYRPQ